MTCVTWPSKADRDATLQAREQLSPPHHPHPRFHREYGGNVAYDEFGSAGGSKRKGRCFSAPACWLRLSSGRASSGAAAIQWPADYIL
ncbi:hypothetical protein X753_21555 [Mesorhizobium sp. LNJC399B00]|uniref:hypothetical protein n=1 Tax=unclassified Mesorhizobium TaxID=325217 RepID=UPI0003CE1E01|nr:MULTISPECIES: hypothetical protein [unclassified Mesorhizobium]ESY03897.1 hypothetical protein X753_21555 [Mesorhizobium sp. LNJC399B00]WJI68910.1 hypothetical protein NLY36_29750 [Mesorhizobium sp. C399B]